MKNIKLLFYNSKVKIYFNFSLIVLLFIGTLFYTFYFKENMGYFFIISIGVLVFFKKNDLKKINKPLIAIDNLGIELEDGFFKWDDIKNEKIINDNSSRRYVIPFLTFQKNIDDSEVRVCVDDLESDLSTLSNNLLLYREAFEEKKKK